jgi:hypothetical protein
MKQLLLMMTIGISIAVLIIGIAEYNSYDGWMNDKDDLVFVKGVLITGEPMVDWVYNKGVCIHDTRSSIFVKYYINGYGAIPKWTKMCKLIDNFLDSAKQVKRQSVINKTNK